MNSWTAWTWLKSEQSVNSWTSGATPGLPGVCGIGVALPISHKLLDYREFVSLSLITQKFLDKFPTNSSFFLDISPHLLIIHHNFFSGLWCMGSATPPPQTPGLPGVCGAWVLPCSESLWWMCCATLIPQTQKPCVYPCPTNSWTTGSLWWRGSATHKPQTQKKI